MKKLVFVTCSRADFGKLKPLIQACEKSHLYEVHIFVSGMHLNERYGKTIDEVKKCGFKNIFPFFNHYDYDSMDSILSKTVDGLSAYVKDLNPDLLICHGDRIETLATCIVGATNNILTAQIEGGDTTGTIDESLRHSSSKLAHLHFVSNDVAKNRLTQMGENPNHIFVIGSPSLDIMLSNNLPNNAEVKMHYNINFANYAILIYHPVVTELAQTEINAKQLVDAVIMSGHNYIIIQPNNDVGTDFITSAYKLFKNNPKIKIFPSMRFEYFQALLKKAKFIIGNSSCGLMEAPYYNTPSINIGSRQNGRVSSASVINCSNSTSEILRAINLATGTPHSTSTDLNYGSGQSATKFLEVLSNPETWNINKQKKFIDL